jgi:hypothetical protein
MVHTSVKKKGTAALLWTVILDWKGWNQPHPRTCRHVISSFEETWHLYFQDHPTQLRAGIPLSVQRLATGWTVRGSNPGGDEIFRTRPTGTGAHPASCTMVTGSFPGVKRPRRDVDQTPLLAPRSRKGPPSGPVTGLHYLYDFHS